MHQAYFDENQTKEVESFLEDMLYGDISPLEYEESALAWHIVSARRRGPRAGISCRGNQPQAGYMSDVLVDLGNTRLKWAERTPQVWRTGELPVHGQELSGALDRVWAGLAVPDKVVLSSVRGAASQHALEKWIGQHWAVPLHVIQGQQELLGVRNIYREPTQLGTDRWAALIGARALTKNGACVVDCGTAVTLDALSPDGDFLGGVIFPGLDLLRASVVQGAQGVLTSAGDDSSCFAHATGDAVAAGTSFGLAGAIERVLREFRRDLGDAMEVLLTGGDAERVQPKLSSPVRLVPDLVLQGLARIADTL